jgi:hypothetical protein
MRQRIWLE